MSKSRILHYELIVSGRVQGVGYRYSAINQANKLGIRGYVKNMPGGTVKLEIEGTDTAVELMLKWCRKGPGTAHVENISIYEGSPKGYKTFQVKY